MTFWGEGQVPGVRYSEKRTYLPYPYADTTLTERRPPIGYEPVNQIPELLDWKSHTAKFANWLDIFHGARSNQDAGGSDRKSFGTGGQPLSGTSGESS